VAIPAGASGGVIDVFSKFRWKNRSGSLGGVDSSILEVPKICLTEYTLNYGTWTANLMKIFNASQSDLARTVKSLRDLTARDGTIKNVTENISNVITSAAFDDPYKSLYLGSPTGFSYCLPYLVSAGAGIRGNGGTNSWVTSTHTLEGLAKKYLGVSTDTINDVAQVVASATATGWGHEEIKEYNGTSPRTLIVRFPLYNTYSLQEANDNFSFVSLFAFQNMKTRTSYMTYLPPKVYVVDSLDEGGVYMPVAYISSFAATPIGTLRSMADFGVGGGDLNNTITGQRMIPEAYNVSITLTELIPESSNIMQGVLGQNKVQVIGSGISINSGSSGSSLDEIFGSPDYGGSIGQGDVYQDNVNNPVSSEFTNDIRANMDLYMQTNGSEIPPKAVIVENTFNPAAEAAAEARIQGLANLYSSDLQKFVYQGGDSSEAPDIKGLVTTGDSTIGSYESPIGPVPPYESPIGPESSLYYQAAAAAEVSKTNINTAQMEDPAAFPVANVSIPANTTTVIRKVPDLKNTQLQNLQLGVENGISSELAADLQGLVTSALPATNVGFQNPILKAFFSSPLIENVTTEGLNKQLAALFPEAKTPQQPSYNIPSLIDLTQSKPKANINIPAFPSGIDSITDQISQDVFTPVEDQIEITHRGLAALRAERTNKANINIPAFPSGIDSIADQISQKTNPELFSKGTAVK